MSNKSPVNVPRLLKTFQNCGMLVLCRHGQAIPSAEGQPDDSRYLTLEGEAQAKATARHFEDTRFNLVTASAAHRARQTACLVAGCLQDKLVGTVEAFRINDDPTDPMNVMFKQLKYSPLSKYHLHEHASHLHELGRAAVTEILTLAEPVSNDSNAHVFVGGHAVYLPQVAYSIGEALEGYGIFAGRFIMEQALNTNLREAEAIVLYFDLPTQDGVVDYLVVEPEQG